MQAVWQTCWTSWKREPTIDLQMSCPAPLTGVVVWTRLSRTISFQQIPELKEISQGAAYCLLHSLHMFEPFTMPRLQYVGAIIHSSLQVPCLVITLVC